MIKNYDYKKIELKAGLEIHQQLNTNKLFCNCPSILRSDEPEYTIKRKLNPVIGETGKIDIAAAHEKSKNLEFNYQVFDTNCLVELDEEPPHEINQGALKIVLQIAHLLNCKIFPVTQIMRKTVIDGSNTSGFQRTVLIAHDGYIETSEGRIRIETIALEEDSARKTLKKPDEKQITYKLDRLGIPLIEVTTYPDLKTPEQVKEAALKIGEILRICNVKRGIGTIRQDLNISIKSGKRVEIKGFQDPKMMIKTIKAEISRQEECIKKKICKSEVRRALPDSTSEFLRPMPGAARMYPETDVPLLKISRDKINESKKSLPKFSSENKKYLSSLGLNEELIRLVIKEKKLEDFKTLNHIIDNPALIVKSLILFQKEIARKEKKSIEEVSKILNTDVLEIVLENVGTKISENDVKTVLKKIFSGKTIEEALEKPDINLEEEIQKMIKKKPGLNNGAYMGLIMGKFKGQISGKEASEIIKKVIK
tara:strand:+ start:13891 stop:15330 length:1440 start_codon:yes stop_codon:yes gene_type:complete